MPSRLQNTHTGCYAQTQACTQSTKKRSHACACLSCTVTIHVLACARVAGGNMVNYVTKKRETKHERGGLCLDEDEARYYFTQLLSAVEYCHKHQVAHR
eukprot:1161350-Pelagomonas_calceolata.AAC.19